MRRILDLFRRTAVCGIVLAMAMAMGIGHGAAQTYPVRPVSIIVPSAPGGPGDVVARLLAERLSQNLGQQVVVDNVPGAGGTLGMSRTARAAPDGYTLMLHQSGFAIAPALYPKLTFNAETDFVTVAMVSRGYSYWVGRKDLPADTFAELSTWMKGAGKPAKVSHPGVGTFGHLQTSLVVRAITPDVTLVPYRGAAPAVNGLLGGHVDVGQVAAAVATPHIRAGNLKFYAHSSEKRIAEFPDVPSYGEVIDRSLNRPLWHALFAPAGTPQPILERINAAIREALADPGLLQVFEKSLIEPFPEEMRSLKASQAYMRDELLFWSLAVRENNITVE